jgi:uncharacterized protein
MGASRVVAVSAVVALLAGCSGEPTGPEPTPPAEDVDGDEVDGTGAAGNDDAEGAAGGAGSGDDGAGDDGAGAGGAEWDAHIDDWPATRVTVASDDAVHELLVRIAAEPADRRQGLMGVEHLPDEAGMLFAFPDERDGGFWMKNTLVPLDIAFTDASGTIVAIEHMVPCDEDPCPTYEPGTEYRVALEVPGGWFEERGVEVGDQVDWDHLPEAS